MAEMIASGTTSFSDMYSFCDGIAQAAADCGLKANISRGVVCFDDLPFDAEHNPRWAEAVELYERVEDAARRELLEETGLQAGELELLGVFSGPEMAHVYPNGDQVSNVDVVYVCRDWHGELTCQPGEVEALGFFAPDALPAPLHEVNRPALNAWMQLREARRQK